MIDNGLLLSLVWNQTAAGAVTGSECGRNHVCVGIGTEYGEEPSKDGARNVD